MMADQPSAAITVSKVSKTFKLPHEKNTSIKSGVVHVFKSRDRRIEVQHALRNISFQVKKGEFFGILGRNGSGKSTLLKILAEIYQPTKGSVEVVGKLVPFIELGVGFNPELTGRENVYLNGALLGFSKKEIDARYDDIVKFAELEDSMDQKLKNYSSGMQVRLAFSVATRAEADILLVDEVLAVGDVDFQRKCYDYFKSLKKSGKTVIFVTHDMSAVREYCDRAILIDDSQITHQGTADEVADEYLKLFIGVTDDSATDTTADRWGSGEVKFDSLKLKQSADSLTIQTRLASKSKETVEGVAVGVRIRNNEEKLVAGVGTTRILKGETLVFKPGETKDLTFTLANIFGRGTHTVEMIAIRSGGGAVFDDWFKAAKFNNVNAESYYPIIPPATLEIKD